MKNKLMTLFAAISFFFASFAYALDHGVKYSGVEDSQFQTDQMEVWSGSPDMQPNGIFTNIAKWFWGKVKKYIWWIIIEIGEIIIERENDNPLGYIYDHYSEEEIDDACYHYNYEGDFYEEGEDDGDEDDSYDYEYQSLYMTDEQINIFDNLCLP